MNINVGIFAVVLFLIFIIPLVSLGIYQENIHLHYLGFFFPLIYILIAASLREGVFGSKINRILVATLVIYSLPQLFSYLGSAGTNQVVRAEEVARYIVREAGGNPYNMVSAYGTHTTPYLYFANISANPPTTERTTTLFLVCQGAPCSDDEINTPFIFLTGPAHPSIASYLGHPLLNYFEGERTVLSNDHVSHGSWVAKINVKIDP